MTFFAASQWIPINVKFSIFLLILSHCLQGRGGGGGAVQEFWVVPLSFFLLSGVTLHTRKADRWPHAAILFICRPGCQSLLLPDSLSVFLFFVC